MHNVASQRPMTAQRVAFSFDVFDTFLLRTCTTPTGVFDRAFWLSPISKTHPHAISNFVQCRISAEAQARKVSLAKSGRTEVKIGEIYARFPFRLFGLGPESIPTLVQAEFDAEIDLCRVNKEILSLYRNAQLSGQKTGFISDTYWDETQLATLLRSCEPDLQWDFLYASCEFGTGKGGKLFKRYLDDQGFDPAQTLHIGDNELADIEAAARHGIPSRHYPQAATELTAQLQRETSAANILCARAATPLDNGFRTLRRVVANRAPQTSPAFEMGVATIGPVMQAFDDFLQRRVHELRAQSGNVAVCFLGRDGHLPYEIWRATRDEPVSYAEINRRVSKIGAATNIGQLADLFAGIPKLSAKAVSEILKLEIPKISKFFQRQDDGIASGAEFAKELPRLIDKAMISDLARNMRKDLLTYLRKTIPDFDGCTDLVIVDLGYSGTIQKALREVLDRENLNIRIHGLYLLSLDDAYEEIAPGDTAEGFISDLVVTPHIKRMLLRNVAILEQLCAKSEGSVRSYRDGVVVREANLHTPEQLKMAEQAQAGALFFAKTAREVARQHRINPFADSASAAAWSAAILGRVFLLPSERELGWLGAFKHDVNLGTTATVPMIDSDFVKTLQIATSMPSACTAHEPPMWLAGSFAAMSPAHAFCYALFGANSLPSELFGDLKHGAAKIGLFSADGSANLESVDFYRTGLGDLRVRVPVSAKMNVQTVVIPLAQIAPEGLIQGVVSQFGPTLRDASFSQDVTAWPDNQLRFAGLERVGAYYRAGDDEGCLIIDVGALKKEVAIISIAITPLRRMA